MRAELRAAGLIVGEERSLERLVNLHFTNAQKTVAANYHAGQVVQFVRGAEGFPVSERVSVLSASDGGTLLVERANGQQQRLDVQRHARAFSVHERSKITLAAGDKLRITQNGSATVALTNLPEHKEASSAVRVDNGTLVTVTGFTDTGAVECAGGGVADRAPAVLRGTGHRSG